MLWRLDKFRKYKCFFFNLEGRCEVLDEVPRSRPAIRFKSHGRYRLWHFYLQSLIANPTCLYRNHAYPLHCVGYDVKGICTLCMRSRACFDSDIFNKNDRFPNPPGPFTYPRTSLATIKFWSQRNGNKIENSERNLATKLSKRPCQFSVYLGTTCAQNLGFECMHLIGQNKHSKFKYN